MRRLLLAEWTKLRTVRRWALGLLSVVVLTVGVSVLGAAGSGASVEGENPTLGPDGSPVVDEFRFVHRTLTGDGSITVQVLSLTGDGQSEWAKAGVIVKDGTRPGSKYAAIMQTPGHGVRLQHAFTEDVAGSPGSAPRWLRLTRTGSSVVGSESPDGTTWRDVGTVELSGLPDTVEVGLFVASPIVHVHNRGLGSSSVDSGSASSTATFGDIAVTGAVDASQPWRGEDIGAQPGGDPEVMDVGGRVTVTGGGDIAPNPPADHTVRLSLTGFFVGLMAVVAVAVLFITSEYKRGLVRTTFTAVPGRVRVLAAKAVVIGAVVFLLALVAAVLALVVAQPILRSNGFTGPSFPAHSLTEPVVWRALGGTALVLAGIAVLSLGVGVILRHSAGAITTVVLLVAVPTLIVSALPVGAGQWLARLTPAAGFSIQQTAVRYDQVDSICVPEDGCLFENPWIGLGVTGVYAVLALGVACWLVRRRDA